MITDVEPLTIPQDLRADSLVDLVSRTVQRYPDKEALRWKLPRTRRQMGGPEDEAETAVHWNSTTYKETWAWITEVADDDATHEAARAFAGDLGKTVIESKDMPGFLVNRMLGPFINEAIFTLMEGTGSAADIDTGARLGLNHPMGPLELSDFIGNDVMLGVMDVLHRGIGDPKFRAAPLLRQMVAAGHLGRKAGRGFYRYDEKGNKLD